MNDQPKALLDKSRQLWSTDAWLLSDRLLKHGHNLWAELVRSSRPWPLGQESRQAIPTKRVLGIVKGHPRQAKTGGGVRYWLSFLVHAPQHLVLHLHQVVRVKEGVA